VACALPFTCEHEESVQSLTDMAANLGPAPGWRPGAWAGRRRRRLAARAGRRVSGPVHRTGRVTSGRVRSR
jgi:hypothetical protein